MSNLIENNKRWHRKNPWAKHFDHARTRCKSGDYGKRGIKLLITQEDFKTLWFRDKAWLLKEPSIDRIDTRGDYAISNCRFIEMTENRRRNLAIPVDQYTKDGNFVKHFDTMCEAAKAVGTDSINISRVARGLPNCNTACGYIWKLSKARKGDGHE